MENKRRLGSAYEAMAVEYLKGKGCFILARNFRCRQGELDIVARDGRYLVFVEVKYRRDSSFGDPLEAVDAKKQRRICAAASYFCQCNGYGGEEPCRFDVVAIDGRNELTHLEHAFEYQI